MTTFRGERHLVEQVESVWAQTRPPDELVVFDDASDDQTWALLEETAVRSPIPVRLHRQPSNVGLRRNVEAALRACAGDVIVLADQDDVWRPEKVAALAEAFTDPTVTLWFSDAALIDVAGNSIGFRAWDRVHFDDDAQRELAEGSALRLLHGQTVTGATMAIRASVLAAALPLPVDMDNEASHLFLHDGWLAIVAVTYGRAVTDPRQLTFYRQHSSQVTGMSMVTGGGGAGPPGTRLNVDRNRAVAVAAVAGPNRSGDEVRAIAAFLEARHGSRLDVLRYLWRGDYRRFARGLRTALRDLA